MNLFVLLCALSVLSEYADAGTYIFVLIKSLLISDKFPNFNTKELFHVKLIEVSLNGSEIH